MTNSLTRGSEIEDTQHVRALVAVVCVIFRGPHVLALRRAQSRPVAAGLWETVSGRVREGEQPLSALDREVREETGLRVRVQERPVDAYVAQRGEEPMTVLVYRADWVSGEVQRSEEHDDHAWVTVAEFAGRTTAPRLAEAVAKAERP